MIKTIKIHKELRENSQKIADIDVEVIVKILDTINELVVAVNELEKKVDFVMENSGDDGIKIKDLYKDN